MRKRRTQASPDVDMGPARDGSGSRAPAEVPVVLRRLTSLGPIAVEATPAGIAGIYLGDPPIPVGGPDVGGWAPHAIANRALDQIEEYLAGQRTTFDLPLAPIRSTPFRERVLSTLLSVPHGHTMTYGELARAVGCGSARAVGQAVGWNPLPIVVPCHRVVASNGRLGGYSGGLRLKRRLLEIEGIRDAIDPDRPGEG